MPLETRMVVKVQRVGEVIESGARRKQGRENLEGMKGARGRGAWLSSDQRQRYFRSLGGTDDRPQSRATPDFLSV